MTKETSMDQTPSQQLLHHILKYCPTLSRLEPRPGVAIYGSPDTLKALSRDAALEWMFEAKGVMSSFLGHPCKEDPTLPFGLILFQKLLDGCYTPWSHKPEIVSGVFLKNLTLPLTSRELKPTLSGALRTGMSRLRDLEETRLRTGSRRCSTTSASVKRKPLNFS
jgi:hypothetical protein